MDSNYHYMRGNTKWRHRGNDLVLAIFARRRLQQRVLVATLSLSLTHSLSLSLYRSLYSYNSMTTTTLRSDCPKSYLYLYELRSIYKRSLNRLTEDIFTNLSSLPVLTDSLPVLTRSTDLVSGSLPILTRSSPFIDGSHPEGPISQQLPRRWL